MGWNTEYLTATDLDWGPFGDWVSDWVDLNRVW